MNIFNSIRVLLFNYFLHKKIDKFLLSKNNIECNKCQKYNISKYEIYDKNVITISPGGYKGIYMLGICKFIKENYNTTNYIFSGASAGSWNSLMMVCNKNIDNTIEDIIINTIKNSKNIFQFEQILKKKLLTYYTTDNFDLDRLFIGVTTIEGIKINTKIYYNFENLEDAIDCCIASSHIPMITGGILYKYKNIITFDGGFSNNPYLHKKNILHITPSMWKDLKMKYKFRNYDSFTTLFSKNKYNFNELFQDGYTDAKMNKNFLDKIFTDNNNQL